eukprot:TRINITY_DN1435_c0_g1_i6.p1 TRINITY_DN1435_c0_g1~~TRINITY_DN1435_c0_g1_i6.p1  ORF type:complete len:141 (+),score=9.23 TRINITY_DN1435_c0_g1_i6:59-481(+)
MAKYLILIFAIHFLVVIQAFESTGLPSILRASPEVACRRAKELHVNGTKYNTLDFLNKCYSKPYKHLEEYTYWPRNRNYRRTGSLVMGTNRTVATGAITCNRGVIICFTTIDTYIPTCAPLKSLKHHFNNFTVYYPPGYI